jgi:hypothetical protein
VRKKTRTAVVGAASSSRTPRGYAVDWTTRRDAHPQAADRNLGAGTRATRVERALPERPRSVYRGTYVFKVFAQNAYGPVDLNQRFRRPGS